MAVHRRTWQPATLPLLMEPVDIGKRIRLVGEGDGEPVWSRRTVSSDANGAIAQRIVLRFALRDETRTQLAKRYGYAARHIQAILSGVTWAEYTWPIRELLIARGFAFRRVRQQNLAAIVAAQADCLRRCLEGDEQALTVEAPIFALAWAG